MSISDAPQYVIIKHDENPLAHRRVTVKTALPETYPFLRAPNDRALKHPGLRVSEAYIRKQVALLPSEAFRKLFVTGFEYNRGGNVQLPDAVIHALINGDAVPAGIEWYIKEFLTTGGNFMEVDSEHGDYVKLKVLRHGDLPASHWNFANNPTMVQKFTGIRGDGLIVNASFPASIGGAGDLYFYAAAPNGEAYLPKSRVEYLRTYGTFTVTSPDGLNVRSAPFEGAPLSSGGLAQGRQFDVRGLHLEGTNVWGQLAENQFVALRVSPYRGFNVYWHGSTWRLQTPGVLKPLAPPPEPTAPVPQPDSGFTHTNQQIFNAYRDAFGWTQYGFKLTQSLGTLKVANMAANRGALFSGPLVGNMMNLTADEKRRLGEAILAQ